VRSLRRRNTGKQGKTGTATYSRETPYEYARRLGQRTYLVVAMRAVDAITTAYLRARFSRLPVGAEHAQAAGQALRDVTQALRRTKDVA